MIGPRLLPVTWYAVLLVARHTAGGGENAGREMAFPGHGTTSTERGEVIGYGFNFSDNHDAT